MDKVFVCLVADLSYRVHTPAMDDAIQKMVRSRADVLEDIRKLHNANEKREDTTGLEFALQQSVNLAEAAAENVTATANSVDPTPFEDLT
eukprot:2021063-Prymnesium_polylepis.1